MSVARRGLLSLSRRPLCVPLSKTLSRKSSSDSQSHEDTNSYPSESFNTPFWRNTLLLSLLGIGLYNVIPMFDEDGDYITRYIALYSTPRDVWARINDKHLMLSAEAAQGQLLVSAAQRPPIHRIRNTDSFNKGSPHCIAVGSQVDTSDIVVKKDKLWTE